MMDLAEDDPFMSDSTTNAYSNHRRLSLSLKQPASTWSNALAGTAKGSVLNGS